MWLSFLAAVLLHPGDSGITFPFQPLELTRDQLQAETLPADVPESLGALWREYRDVAGEFDLLPLFNASPPVLMLTSAGKPEATWFLYLVAHTTTVFRQKLGLGEDVPFEPIVAFHVDRDKLYSSLIDVVAERAPYLESWKPVGKAINGFAHCEPPMVAVLEGKKSIKGTNLENNLVHLLTHLLVCQYFGAQPFWVREGLALDLEVSVTGKLYAFCARGSFVPVSRVGGWRRDLQKAWRSKQFLEVPTLTNLDQERFDEDGCYLALGVMRFLQKERPGELPRLLRGYKAERDANLSKDAFYIPPAERQAEILAVFFNEDWPELASARMAAGEADEEIAADASLAALPEKEVLKTKTRTP